MTYSDGTAYDSSVFSFNTATRYLSIYTNDNTKINSYTLKITGYILDPNKKISTTISVSILSLCSTTILSASAD